MKKIIPRCKMFSARPLPRIRMLGSGNILVKPFGETGCLQRMDNFTMYEFVKYSKIFQRNVHVNKTQIPLLQLKKSS